MALLPLQEPNHMKKTLFKLLVAGFLLLLPVFGFGQTSLTFTSFSAAGADSKTTSVVVASATGITAGTSVLFVEDGTGGSSIGSGELLAVTSVSGTTIGVQRGSGGSIANPHISGALVIVGPPNAFVAIEPSGACTASKTLYTPMVNYKTGNQWLCSTVTNSWVPGFFNTSAASGVTAAVASVAGATNPSGPLFHITGTNAITAFGSSTTVGVAGGGGSKTDVAGASFCIIPDAIFTTTATNNIALASTAVVNKLLCYVFDQTNKKYVPSY
jgi:hypothetical protein